MATLEILGAVDQGARDGMTVAELARALGRDNSVASRQLKGLVESGLVERDTSGRFRLSWRLFTVAAQAGDRRLVRASIPVLRILAGTVRERAYLTVLSGHQVLTVHSESSNRSVEAIGWIGNLVPVLNTSSGLALISHFPDEQIELLLSEETRHTPARGRQVFESVRATRLLGYAVSEGLFDPDLIGIGAPIRDIHDRVVAAINISGPTYRIKPHATAIAGHVMAAASKLSASLINTSTT